MTKLHEIKTIEANGTKYGVIATREKNSPAGCPRWRLYIIDGGRAIETIVKGYDKPENIAKDYILNGGLENV